MQVQAARPTVEPRRSQRGLWVASAVLVVATLGLLAAIHSPWKGAYSLGRFIAGAFVPTAMVASVLVVQRLIRKRGVQPSLFWALLLGTAFAALRFYSEDGMSRIQVAGRVANRSGRALVAYTDTLRALMLLKLPVEPLGDSAVRFGELAPLALVINRYLAEIQRDYLCYDSFADRAKPESMLSATTLGSQHRTTEAVKSLRQAARLADSLGRRSRDLTAQFTNEVTRLDIPERSKLDFVGALLVSSRPGDGPSTAFYRSELQGIGKLIPLMDFVDSRRGGFGFDGDRIMFARQADLDSFNSLLARLGN
jgi:hypothetical protein